MSVDFEELGRLHQRASGVTCSMTEEMPCPRCKTMHAKGKYAPLGKPMRSGVLSGTPYAPQDVDCQCGAKLRHVVPIFKVDPYGWHWKIL